MNPTTLLDQTTTFVHLVQLCVILRHYIHIINHPTTAATMSVASGDRPDRETIRALRSEEAAALNREHCELMDKVCMLTISMHMHTP